MPVKPLSIHFQVKSAQEGALLEQACQRYTPNLHVQLLDHLMMQISLVGAHAMNSDISSSEMMSMELNKDAWFTPDRDEASIVQRLVCSGIQVDLRQVDKEDVFRPWYQVTIFSLSAIKIVKLSRVHKHGGWTATEGQEPNSKLWRKLEASALRALYALGLDTGEVIISVSEEQLTIIHHVTPYLDLRQLENAALYLYASERALRMLQAQHEQENLIQMGMDPEFILFDPKRSKVIPASKFLNRLGIAGCDSVRIEGRLRFPLAELRPRPAAEPQQLMKHLLGSFRSAYEMINDSSLIWQAGGMPQRGFCLGGHLHFSGITLIRPLLEVLDNYLALLVMMLEDEDSLKRRPRYGFLGDFRMKEYGGFEYRTLPSFLISPLVTKGVLALAKLIVHHYDELPARPLYKEEIFRAFYTGDRAVIHRELSPLIGDITSLVSYKKYEKYMAPFLQAVRLGHPWNGRTDIRQSWKFQIIF